MKKINMIMQLTIICIVALSTMPYCYGAASPNAKSPLSAIDNAIIALLSNTPTKAANMHICQLLKQGEVCHNNKQYLQAIAYYKEALQKYTQHYTEKSTLLTLICDSLGMTYLAMQACPQYSLYVQQALTIQQTCLSIGRSADHAFFCSPIGQVTAQNHHHIVPLSLPIIPSQAGIQLSQAVCRIELSMVNMPSKANPVGDKELLIRTSPQAKDHQEPSPYKPVLAKPAKDVYWPLEKEKEQCKVAINMPKKKLTNPCYTPIEGNGDLIKDHLNPFVCDQCGKDFRNQYSLNIHMRVHTGEKPFNCSICNKKFSQKHNMKDHMRVHTGEKPFACPLCNKKFAHKQNMKVHLRVHTGEKPFACPLCNKKFSQKHNMKGHLRVHTGEKPFNCSICNKKFAQKHSMKEHLRVHTGEKPFNCSICNKKFSQKRSVKRHIVVHTKEKPFVYPLCNKKFARKHSMKTHIRKVHKKMSGAK